MGTGWSFGLSVSSPIDVEKEDRGVTDLHEAAADNDIELVKQLLCQRAEIDAKNIQDQTPLHYAASKNICDSHYEVIETLLKNGANPDARTNRGLCTPFYYLVQKGNLKIVQLFLDYRPDLNTINSMGRHLLFSAIHNHKNLEVMQMLINLGLDVNHCDNIGKTALHDAAINNVDDSYMNVAELLLKNGADLTIKDDKGYTPMARLVDRGNAKIIEMFFHYTDEFDVDSEYAQIIFLITIQSSKNVDVVQLLIDVGYNVHHNFKNKGEESETPLHFACSYESTSIEVIKCLLKNGADMNLINLSNSTPLAHAMRKSSYSLGKSEKKWERKVKLIVEHTDLSVNVSKESHILSWHEDRPPGNYKKVLEHIAKLLALNIPVHPVLLEAINNRSTYVDHIEACNKELKLAKSIKLDDSWLTFYNLLLDSRKKLKNYAGNVNLIEAFQKSDCEKIFPIYGASMVLNVNKAIKRRKLYDKSLILLSDCLPIFNPTHLIIRDTLDCILCKRDLSKFCD